MLFYLYSVFLALLASEMVNTGFNLIRIIACECGVYGGRTKGLSQSPLQLKERFPLNISIGANGL